MLNVVTAQTETGTPYILNRDTVNRGNMQSNLGTIKSSNLCIEYLGYSDDKNSSQCALALIPVMNYVENDTFNFKDFSENVQLANFVLNRIIDNNKWTTKESEFAGKNQRTVGLGIAGLADLAMKLDLAYTSEEFKTLNREISYRIYYNSILGSCKYVKKYNIETKALKDCNMSKGDILNDRDFIHKDNLDLLFKELYCGVLKPANTLLIAYMPSASTSKLLGCNESFEPIQDLFFTRKGSEGEFTMANKYLLQDLEKRGLWNQQLANEIMIKGSLKDIDFVELGLTVEDSDHLKQKYKTVWEIGMKTYIEMCADRQVYTDQSMSMNTYYSEAKASKIISGIIHAWKLGLKTGVYYTKVKKQTKPNSNLSFVQEVKTSNNKGIDCFGCSA
jgi:ribonucleotide reductase alpha subunit